MMVGGDEMLLHKPSPPNTQRGEQRDMQRVKLKLYRRRTREVPRACMREDDGDGAVAMRVKGREEEEEDKQKEGPNK